MVAGGKPARIAGVRQNQGLPRIEITALKKWIGPGSRANRKLGTAVKSTRNPGTELLPPNRSRIVGQPERGSNIGSFAVKCFGGIS